MPVASPHRAQPGQRPGPRSRPLLFEGARGGQRGVGRFKSSMHASQRHTGAGKPRRIRPRWIRVDQPRRKAFDLGPASRVRFSGTRRRGDAL